MKRYLKAGLWTLSGCLLLAVVCVWFESYRAPHSLQYSRATGEIEAVIDQGLLQIDLVRGDTEDRGFEQDSYGRSAGWGKAKLEMFKSKAGITGRLADAGFAAWSYERTIHTFGPSLAGRAIFLPLWFLALVVGAPALFELVMVVRKGKAEKGAARVGAVVILRCWWPGRERTNE